MTTFERILEDHNNESYPASVNRNGDIHAVCTEYWEDGAVSCSLLHITSMSQLRQYLGY